MDDRERPKAHGALPPETALSLLGNEVRATILWTLSEARGGEGPPPVLSFSELRERADLAVDSSQFNYHLQQLEGTYVERVDPDDAGEYDDRPVPEMAGWPGEGYRLTPEGTTLIRIVRAWSADGEARLDPFEIGTDCHHCGTTLEARYGNAIFAIQCPGCDYLYDYNLTPPGILAGSDDAAPDVGAAPGTDRGPDIGAVLRRVAEYNRTIRLSFARGSCPYCAADVHTAFQDPADTGYPGGDRRKVLVRRGCRNCGNKDNLTVGEVLLRDAGLIAFCHEHGLDVTTTPIWELAFAATDRYTTVRSTDPWTVALRVDPASFPGGKDADADEELELVIDGDLTVVEGTRL